MDYATLFPKHRERLEDFWARRQNKPRFARQVHLFDRHVWLTSNHEGVLSAADHSLRLYSVAPLAVGPTFSVQLVVHAGPVDPGSLPANLFNQIHYAGDANWLTIQLGLWGQCFVDTAAGWAIAVLSPELADEPELVSRCLLDTVFTNLFIGSGYAMLHASCLIHDERALLLMAPHNSGKSTTALRLVLAGFRLLSDSMIFLPPDSQNLQFLGFPVGKIKLRQDMLSEFPELWPFLLAEPVRHEIKYSVDLRRLDPGLVYEEAASPAAIELCLLSAGRSGGRDTHLVPASRSDVIDSVTVNSLFYDTETVWQGNLAALGRLVESARWHHLVLGTDPQGIVTAVSSLFGEAE